MFRRVIGVVMALTLSLNFATGALASNDEVVRTNTVDAILHAGAFDLQVRDANSFGDITISINDEKYMTSFAGDFRITDLRGIDEEWQLSVSSTPFTNITNPVYVFPNVLTIHPPQSIQRVGNTGLSVLPTMSLGNETVLDDGDVLIAKSENGSGLGEFTLTFPEDAVGLVVTPAFKEGVYESVLTWNLLSVPN